MGFFGMFEGPSQGERDQYNKLNASADFATGTGEADITASSDFMRSILSGDPTQISKALAPQFSNIAKQTQQEKNNMAEFAPRSGGTAAAAANLDTAGRTERTNLVGSLTGGAASSLGSMGSSLLGQGMSGRSSAFDMSHVMHDQYMQSFNDMVKQIESMVSGAATGFAATPAGGSQLGGALGGAFGGMG